MTLRAHLKAILLVAEGAPDEDHRACDIYFEASAALADLDNARWITALDQGSPPVRGRLIPDDEEPHGHPTHRAD